MRLRAIRLASLECFATFERGSGQNMLPMVWFVVLTWASHDSPMNPFVGRFCMFASIIEQIPKATPMSDKLLDINDVGGIVFLSLESLERICVRRLIRRKSPRCSPIGCHVVRLWQHSSLESKQSSHAFQPTIRSALPENR